MSKLDEILEVSDKHSCFNCHTDDIDIPKQQIKDLFKALIIESDSDIKTIFKKIEEL